jgi:hypothetical protein
VPFPDELRLIGNGKALPAYDRIFNAVGQGRSEAETSWIHKVFNFGEVDAALDELGRSPFGKVVINLASG